MNKTVFFILSLFCINISAQQVSSLQFDSNQKDIVKELENKITKYEIIQLPVDSYLEQLNDFNGPKEIKIELSENDIIPLQVVPEHDLVYRQKVQTTSDGQLDNYVNRVFPYKGHVMNGQAYARLTIADNMFYVYIQGDGFSRFIEPLRYIIPGANPNLYISYYGKDVVFPEGNFCASNQVHSKTKEIESPQKSSLDGECFETELAMASDFLMYQKYNSDIDDLIARNVGVMNNVQGNYDDEFADEVQFVIVEQYISDCNTCDPWTSSTDVDVLLPNFRDWGPNGFDETHDLGHLWTERDFDGPTIAYAYVGVVCTGSRYAILQDFSNNANFLRVLTSHETGHNFDAVHDASGANFIMAPSVNSATAWSTNSINDIESHYNSRNCLTTCAPPAPPVSNFFANLTEICPGSTIQFFDQTENGPNTWNWTFIGGDPVSSSLQNPVITYENPGTYSVTLETTNDTGGDSETKNGYITVSNAGAEFLISDNFVNDLSNWTVSNPDNSFTWETATIPGSTGNNTVAWINNYDYQDGVGDADGLESPVIDLTGRQNVTLELEYAYARYNANNNDRFRIMGSIDGGNSYTTLFFDGFETGGGNFATAPDNTDAFSPLDASEWCIETTYGPNCIELDLSELSGESNVVIRLENISGYGNNLYIDNVNLSASCAVLAPPVSNFTSNISSGCAPLVVNFQDLSLNNPDSWNWTFPGGNPSSSTLQNPIVVYETTGDYSVTLEVTNEVGSNEVTSNNYINVIDVPVASFTSSIDGSTVTFNSNSIGGDSFSWDFDDGQNSSQENPIHVFTEDGVYEVELLVGNLCGSSSYTVTIEIATEPFASFSQDVNEGCASFEVQFTNMSSENSDTYEWIFEGGNPATSTLENPIVTYSSRGTYDVTLIAFNEIGSDTYESQNSVIVNDVPETSFDFTLDENTVTFTNTTQFGETYYWDFGDGNFSEDENPIHTYDTDDAYDVSLVATNECGTFTVNETVSISNLPFANFSSNVTNGCAEFIVEFENNSSSNSDTYQWTFEGGNPGTSSLENPVITYSTTGVYNVQLIVSNEEGSDELLQNNYITVEDVPNALYSFTNNQLEYSFENLSTDGDSYFWEFGDGENSALVNPLHTYDQDGDYLVTLTVTNSCGEDVYEIMVSAVSSVTAGFSTSITNGCADFTVQFDNSSSGNATDFEWSFPGGSPSTSTEENPTVVYTEAGTYSVTLMSSNDDFSDEVIQQDYIIVNDVPEPSFTFDFNMLDAQFTNTTENATSYEWDFGDGEFSFLENPSHTYEDFGDYVVVLTAINECGEVTETMNISVSSLPTANFSSNITQGCTVVEIQFEDLSTSNSDTWFWTFEGGNPSTSEEQNPFVSYENAGIFDVSLEVTNESGSDSYSLEDFISIQTLPSISLTEEINGNEVMFSVESDNTEEFTWTVEETGEQYFGSSPNIVFPADGVYVVELEATNDCGTIFTTTAVNITAYPNADFEADITEGCAPATIQFSDKTTDSPTEFMWTFEGGSPATSSMENPVINYSDAGSYSVELIASNIYGNDTIEFTHYIELEDGPVADFEYEIMGASVDFTNTSTGDGSVKWNFGDNETSDEENPSHIFQITGDYVVTLIIDNGGNCQDTIERIVSILVDNVKEIEGLSLELFPNPNNGTFVLNMDGDINSDISYTITNIIGQDFETGIISNFDNNYSKHFGMDLTPGVYYLRLETENKLSILRFVVQ